MTDRLILSGAMLLDGTGAVPQPGRAVVVEGGRVAAVVEERDAPAGPRLRLDGLTLLPGLINCHVHLCLGGEADPVGVLREEPPALTAVKVALRARQTVEAGVTTVRDLGGRDFIELAVRRAVAEGVVPGPRILAAGRVVCMTGGHGWWVGREADGPDEVRKAVREQLRAGADVIKVIATGGVMTPGVEPGSPQLGPEELRAAVEEATKAGRRVAAHAQGSQGIANAVEAGVASIEHGIFLTEELVARMKREGVALVPTLVAAARIAGQGTAGGIPEFMVRKSRAIIESHVASFQLALRAGVPIACGTDAGTPLNPHGSVLPELELMVEHGMAPLEAVRAATAAAAQLLGLGAEIGQVAPGFAADLLAVAGNPAERIQSLADVRLVLAGGKIVVNRLTG
jgi:imidazolonepropionase-like amidohydrolase